MTVLPNTERFGFERRIFRPDETETVSPDEPKLTIAKQRALKKRLKQLVSEHEDTVVAALTEMAECYGKTANVHVCVDGTKSYDTYCWEMEPIIGEAYGLSDIVVMLVLDSTLLDESPNDIFIVTTAAYDYQEVDSDDDVPLYPTYAIYDCIEIARALYLHTGITAMFSPEVDTYALIVFSESDEELVCGTD